MKTFFIKNILAAACIALLFSGCGGSSGDSSSSSDTSGGGASGDTQIVVEGNSLTKAEFIKQADRICEQQRGQFEEKFEEIVGAGGLNALASVKLPKAEALVYEAYAPPHEQIVEQVSALGAPDGDEQVITALLEAIQTGVDEAEREPLKFSQSTKEDFPSVAKAERLSIEYGLNICGQS